MAGDSDLFLSRPPPVADLVSDDDCSVAADSWSIKSDYWSTLDDDRRHVDAAEVLSGCNFRTSSDYSCDGLFEADNVLETKLERKFQLVMDKGALDVIKLHPNGLVKRKMRKRIGGSHRTLLIVT